MFVTLAGINEINHRDLELLEKLGSGQFGVSILISIKLLFNTIMHLSELRVIDEFHL